MNEYLTNFSFTFIYKCFKIFVRCAFWNSNVVVMAIKLSNQKLHSSLFYRVSDNFSPFKGEDGTQFSVVFYIKTLPLASSAFVIFISFMQDEFLYHWKPTEFLVTTALHILSYFNCEIYDYLCLPNRSLCMLMLNHFKPN